jgi:hypothetical protein
MLPSLVSRGTATMVDVLRSVALEGILAWQLLASDSAGCSAIKYFMWSLGLKAVGVSSSSSSNDRLRRPRRLRTAALPSARMS